MANFDYKTALTVGAAGCISFTTAFVISALAKVPMRVTLTTVPNPALVVEINPIAPVERTPIILNDGETLIAYSLER
jgi:hypothetical protein